MSIYMICILPVLSTQGYTLMTDNTIILLFYFYLDVHVSDTLFLNKLIEDIDNFEELGSNLNIESQALKSITERNSDDSRNGQKEIISSWLQTSGSTADIETLIEAAESKCYMKYVTV